MNNFFWETIVAMILTLAAGIFIVLVIQKKSHDGNVETVFHRDSRVMVYDTENKAWVPIKSFINSSDDVVYLYEVSKSPNETTYSRMPSSRVVALNAKRLKEIGADPERKDD